MSIDDKELAMIYGGATTISSSVINSVCKLITTLLDLGRNVGSALRYAVSGNSCKL